MVRKDKDTMTVLLVGLVAVGSFVWGYFSGAKDTREVVKKEKADSEQRRLELGDED